MVPLKTFAIVVSLTSAVYAQPAPHPAQHTMPAPMGYTASPLVGGALPTTYDPNWNHYTGLTHAQIIAYQSFPQDLAIYVAHKATLAAHAAITPAATPASISAAVQAAYAAQATELAGINAKPPTITTRTQVDAAFAAAK